MTMSTQPVEYPARMIIPGKIAALHFPAQLGEAGEYVIAKLHEWHMLLMQAQNIMHLLRRAARPDAIPPRGVGALYGALLRAHQFLSDANDEREDVLILAGVTPHTVIEQIEQALTALEPRLPLRSKFRK